MELSGWERVMNGWMDSFYTLFLLSISILIALIVGLRFKRKEKMSYLILVYIVSGLLLFVVTDLSTAILNLNVHYSRILDIHINIFFALVETFVFYNFFLSVLVSKIFIRILKPFIILIFALLIFLLTKTLSFESTSSSNSSFLDKILTLELSLFAICSLAYYFELLSKKTDKDLLQSPSFWIVTGLFFYCLVIIPFFFISTEIRSNRYDIYILLFSIHYLFMSIFFLCITKAFLCKRPLTT